MEILEWIDSESLSENPEIKSRNLFANKYVKFDPQQIAMHYNSMSLDGIQEFLINVLNALGVQLSGIGVELGAGIGGISNSILSSFTGVKRIYAVEIVPEVVRLLQVKVTEFSKNNERLVPVIGSFDKLELQDSSIDFIIEFDSLHHSNNLETTLREAARVLKPGGIIIALDRMHQDSLTNEQRDFMEGVEYGGEYKRLYGISEQTKLTRKQNGEHEIRKSEWELAFKNTGLQVEKCINFHRKSMRGFAYGVISQVPFSWRKKMNKYPMLSKFPLTFFWMYCLPFFPILWKKSHQPLNLKFSDRRAFITKTAFIARKID